MPGLLAQGGTPGLLQFTATLFDLIPARALPDGAGDDRTEDLGRAEDAAGRGSRADARRRRGPGRGLPGARRPGRRLDRRRRARAAIALPVGSDRGEDRTGNSERFNAFKSAVGTEVSGRRWFLNIGLAILLGAAAVLALVGGLTLVWGIQSFNVVAPSWNSIVKIALGACGLVNAVALVIAAFNRRLWRRRTPAAQIEAERWEAFAATLPTSRASISRRPPRFELGRNCSCTGSRSGWPSACCRARSCICRKRWRTRARSIGWCQGFSEPESGSDLASLRTTARPDGDGWLISGQKIWTSYATMAQWCFLLARTHKGEKKQQGLTIFLVPMDDPAIQVRPIRAMLGPHHLNEVFFDDLRVTRADVLGEVDNGWSIVAVR